MTNHCVSACNHYDIQAHRFPCYRLYKYTAISAPRNTLNKSLQQRDSAAVGTEDTLRQLHAVAISHEFGSVNANEVRQGKISKEKSRMLPRDKTKQVNSHPLDLSMVGRIQCLLLIKSYFKE